jgi:hypothetical protein
MIVYLYLYQESSYSCVVCHYLRPKIVWIVWFQLMILSIVNFFTIVMWDRSSYIDLLMFYSLACLSFFRYRSHGFRSLSMYFPIDYYRFRNYQNICAVFVSDNIVSISFSRKRCENESDLASYRSFPIVFIRSRRRQARADQRVHAGGVWGPMVPCRGSRGGAIHETTTSARGSRQLRRQCTWGDILAKSTQHNVTQPGWQVGLDAMSSNQASMECNISKTTLQNHSGGYLSGFTKFNVYNSWFYSSEGHVDHPRYVRGLRRLFPRGTDAYGPWSHFLSSLARTSSGAKGVFGLRNEVIYHLSHFLYLVCRMEWVDPSPPHCSQAIN